MLFVYLARIIAYNCIYMLRLMSRIMPTPARLACGHFFWGREDAVCTVLIDRIYFAHHSTQSKS
ncbi:hypothetical protein D8I24_8029 [Cupriavidus necator H850]|nr:hypothetical protein D8I24_8029 [Cupriavidus necator H850]